MEEQKLKVGDPVTQEVYDFVRGLKHLGDLDGLYFKIERLETLAMQIEDITEGEDGDGVTAEEQEVIDAAYWQRSLIDEIKAALNNQGRMIMALHRRFDIPFEENFKVDSVKRDAIMALYGLFSCGELIGDKVKPSELRAWSRTYGVDFDQVVSMLAPETDSCRSAAG